MQAEALSAFLYQLYDPACPADQKHHTEQQLNAFFNSSEGLDWALTCVQSPNADPQQQFFASSVLEGAVARRWDQLPPAHQTTLQNCLWMHVTQASSSSLPHFVTSKLRAALAQLACINWQLQFWTDLQASLNIAATAEAGVRLIGATLEQLHSMAQGITSALSGKVLSSDLLMMQSRRQEAQIMSFQMLCPLLEHLINSNSGNNNLFATLATAPPGLTEATLDALRVAITTSNVELFSTQSSIPGTELGSQIASLLLPIISLAADTAFLQNINSINNNGSTITQLVILSMSCLEDLINRPHQPPLQQKILAQGLPAVAALCRSWHKGTTKTNTAALDSDQLGVFTRLITQILQHSFAFAVSNFEISAGVQEVLREITNLAAAAASVPGSDRAGGGNINSALVRVLAASEAWHAVLTYMEDLEASNWSENDSFNTPSSPHESNFITDGDGISAEKQCSFSFYKQGILHFSHLLLSIFFTESTHHQQNQQNHVKGLPVPPFLVQNLDTTTDSGAALEDWIAAVGDNNEDFDFQTEGTQDNLDTADADGSDGDPEDDVFSSSSEAHVFAQQVEYFIAHATSSYNKDLVPVLFRQLAPAMTAAAQARLQSEQGLVYLCNFRAQFALKLIARCAPHLPTSNLTAVANFPSRDSAQEKEEGVSSLSGGHVLQLVQALIHFGGEQLIMVRTEAQQAQQQQQRILMASVLDTLVTIYRTLSPLMTTWLPQIMLTKAGTDSDVQVLVSQLLRGVVEFVAAGVECSVLLNKINSRNTGSGGGSQKLAVAASQTLLSVTSIALSSGMKPPVVLLQSISSTPAFGSLAGTVASGVHGHSSSPPRAALRSLIVSLSDLALRSWGAALQASTVDINERKTALSAVTVPLLQIIMQSNTQAAQLPPGCSTATVPQLSLAVLLATDIVESYLGSPKVVRAAVFEVFAKPMVVAVMTVLKSLENTNDNGVKNKLGTTLLGFISSCLRAFPAELGTSSIGELLSALVAAFSTINNSPTASDLNKFNGEITISTSLEASLDADVALLSIITSALSQGGSKHAALVMPAMHFGLQIWDKSAVCGATHIKAQILASLLSVMAQHWRSLSGGSGRGDGDGSVAEEVQPPSAVVEATLIHVSSFLSDAASTRAIPSASDVNLVLETLIDIQSRSKLFWKPYFSGWKDLTMESILSMLLTRMYTGAQESLIDTLYQLAAANWSHFLLSFLPAFAEKGLAGLGARGAELAAGLGTGDMEAWAFEKGVLAFVNDAIYWEKRV
ncbi:hypothetical protein Ndes2526B_g08872 [Nannochloris sp. 'desiccata']